MAEEQLWSIKIHPFSISSTEDDKILRCKQNQKILVIALSYCILYR